MKLNEVIAKYGNQEVDESKIKEVLGVEESKVYKPDFNEHYYFSHEGGVTRDRFIASIDESRYELGNCYKTFEEAEFARDKQKFLTKFERYLRENEDEPVDWSNEQQRKLGIMLDSANGLIQIDGRYRYMVQGNINTTNRVALAQFIKDNESDIKKYMYGVE